MKNFDSRLFVYDCTSAIAPPAGPAEANLLEFTHVHKTPIEHK